MPKYEIVDAMRHYEHLNVRVKGKRGWIFMDYDKLKGAIVEGTINKKRTRTWLE